MFLPLAGRGTVSQNAILNPGQGSLYVTFFKHHLLVANVF